MDLDWFTFDSWSVPNASSAWLLTGIITSLVLILGIAYTWYKRRQLENEDEKEIEVHWPMEKGKKKTEAGDDDDEDSKMKDPLEFCSHIPSEVRKATQRVTIKKIEEEMTDEQKAKEKDIQRQQLEAIFKLMEDQEDKFGVGTMEDMQEQMKLYR